MKPAITLPQALAKQRFTGKVRKPRNIKLIEGLKANHQAKTDALTFLQDSQQVSTSSGMQLDAWGERFGIPRDGMSDDEYRLAMLEQASGVTMSQQSRPSIGSYIGSVYGVDWLKVEAVGVAGGAEGAVFNRSPLGRMIYLECAGMAPAMRLPESLVSATFAGAAYSAATAPNIKPIQNAPALPGNVFFTVWGGLKYQKTERAVRVGPGVTVRVKSGLSILTRQTTNEVINRNEEVAPRNTFLTVKNIEVSDG